MLERFLDFCRQNNLIEPQDSVLLAVSGGADSVFMSFLFKKIEEIFKLKIGVAYINHKQRDVREEMNFVKNFSKNYNWKFFLKNIKMDEGGSPEELLRIQRLRCLKGIAKNNGYKKIALAHTKDDQAETILMRFLKGTSLRGLSGIKPISEGIYIHPLLCFKKEEILDYLKKEKIPFLLDPTNFSFSFLRNKLRHLVIPFLEREINPSLKENLIQMAGNLLEDENFLKDKAREAYFKVYKKLLPFPALDRGLFLKMERAIQRRVLVSILMDFNFRFESKHIDLLIQFIEEKPNKEAKFLNKDLTFISTYDNIYICPYQKPPEPFFLKRSRKIYLSGWGGSLSILKKGREGDFSLGYKDMENLKLTSLYYERGLKKELKKLKIPYPLRNYLPVFTMGNKIMWIPGFYKVDSSSKNKIYVRWNYEFSKDT